MRRVARLLWFLLILFLLWFGGFLAFMVNLPDAPEVRSDDSDAIVVLTGGSQRVAEAIRLLAAGEGERLLVTGVHQDVRLAELAALLPADIATDEAAAAIDCCIDLGYEADDTAGNARETAAWMRDHDFTSLRLVTADYHMPRSLFLFRCAMPDVTIVAHPVFPSAAAGRGWFENADTFDIAAGEYVKYWTTRLLGCGVLGR